AYTLPGSLCRLDKTYCLCHSLFSIKSVQGYYKKNRANSQALLAPMPPSSLPLFYSDPNCGQQHHCGRCNHQDLCHPGKSRIFLPLLLCLLLRFLCVLLWFFRPAVHILLRQGDCHASHRMPVVTIGNNSCPKSLLCDGDLLLQI